MKKRLLAIILCGLLTCGAVSCGSSEKKSSKTSESKTSASEETTEEKTTEADTAEDKEKETEKTSESSEKTSASEEKTEADEDNGGTPAEDSPELEEAKALLKKYAECTVNKDVDTLLDCMYPKAVVDALKSSEMQGSLSGMFDMIEGEISLDDFSIKGEKVLSDKAVKGANAYFGSVGSMFGGSDVKYNVSAGYSMTMHIKATYKGETDESDEELTVVKIDGEGWKLVPVDADTLSGMAAD